MQKYFRRKQVLRYFQSERCSGILKDGNKEYVVTYNPSYRTSIDKKSLEKLKINHPDIYDDYVSVTESRRFAVKAKEAA